MTLLETLRLGHWERKSFYNKKTNDKVFLGNFAATYIVGIDSAEREVICWDAHSGEHIEECTLSHVGKTHNSDL